MIPYKDFPIIYIQTYFCLKYVCGQNDRKIIFISEGWKIKLPINNVGNIE